MGEQSADVVEGEQDGRAQKPADPGAAEGLAEADEADEEGLNAVGGPVAEALARGGLEDGVEQGGDQPQDAGRDGAEDAFLEGQLAVAGMALGDLLGTADLHRGGGQVGAFALAVLEVEEGLYGGYDQEADYGKPEQGPVGTGPVLVSGKLIDRSTEKQAVDQHAQHVVGQHEDEGLGDGALMVGLFGLVCRGLGGSGVFHGVPPFENSVLDDCKMAKHKYANNVTVFSTSAFSSGEGGPR